MTEREQIVSEWMGDYCLTLNEQFFSYIMARTSVRFVLDQHADFEFYSTSSMKQPFAGRHVAPRGHVILIQSQPVFALSPSLMLHD